MDFECTPEEQMLQKTLNEYARNELLPNAAHIDEKAVFPKKQFEQMAEMGLMGIFIPEEYGGAAMSIPAYAIAMEEISAGCASCGVIMSVNNSLVGDPLLNFGTEEQKTTWLKPIAQGKKIGCFALSEPGAGSDASAQQTTSSKKGDTWVLNGVKNWITNGLEADVCIVFSIGDKSKGVKAINAHLVPTKSPGFKVQKNEQKLGIKASSTTQILLENVQLGPESLLGKENEGFKIAMKTLDGGRIGIAAQALGIARQAMADARSYAHEREAFGKRLAKLQAIQFMFADMATEIQAARLLIWQAAYLKEKKQPFSTHSAMAKLYASEMSNRVTNKALQIFGGFGYSKEYPAERHLRDARITEIYEGTSEIQRLVISRSVLSGQLEP